MAITVLTYVVDLKLDLANFRTVPQTTEVEAVHAMISISPDRFWALMESLLDDGYLPTENILVIKSGKNESELLVKEGNRRIAALKMLHGLLPVEIDLPGDIKAKISKLPSEWKTDNEKVPCTIYEAKDALVVDRIVTLAHGKGEKAGRDQWSAVARARHNRDIMKASEAALDLLEKYLKTGKNFLPQQGERWAGDFPLSVLDEAMKKLASFCGATNSTDLGKKYLKSKIEMLLMTLLRTLPSRS